MTTTDLTFKILLNVVKNDSKKHVFVRFRAKCGKMLPLISACFSLQTAPHTPERSLPAPEPFSGEFDKCGGFLTQITLQFRQLRRTYETDGAKIAFMVQLLRGQALNWAQIDEHLRARRGTGNYISQRSPGRMETTSGGGALSGSHASDSMEEGEQPMQLGCSRLSPEERYRRWRAGECFYCGRRGHIAMDCPARPKDSARQ
uniref:CCHC-type domain-containing protein n=1 Tax=Oreochromis aureus TaxID=47969 RepID=A0AAZ1XEP7_OREAU